MARTVRQRVALGVMIAFATVGGSDLSLSKGLGQAELGLELNGKKLFERETFGGNGRTCQHLPQQAHGHPHSGRRAADHR